MRWQKLTDREKELDHKIEVCGMRLDNTNGCLRNVMRRIGALQGEEAFVKSRIAFKNTNCKFALRYRQAI